MSAETPPRTGHGNLSWIIAGAVVLAIVLGGITALVISGTTQKPAASKSLLATPVRSSCSLPAGSQDIPSNAAPETKWTLVGQFAVPDSPKTYGPQKVEKSGVRTCFARSPIGALYAMVNLDGEGSDPSLIAAATEYAVVPDSAKQAILSQLKTAAPSPHDTGVQVVGYRFLTYSNSVVNLDIAIRSSTGVIASFVTQMKWVSGDWRVVTGADGSSPTPPQSIATLAGYVAWQGA